MPTYVLGASQPQTCQFYKGLENGDICPNLTYLGKRGLYTCHSGIRVAYVSGVQQPSADGVAASTSAQPHQFTIDDVRATRNSCLASKSTSGEYRGIDILCTSQWPLSVDADNEARQTVTPSALLAWLALEIRPRYHFCASAAGYFERQPYRNAAGPNSALEVATRFVALAPVGNATKEKYVYALSVTPVDRMRVLDLIQRTTTETVCPYDSRRFAQLSGGGGGVGGSAADADSSRQFFYDMSEPAARGNKRGRGANHSAGGGGPAAQKRPRRDFDQEKCWFCLSSASVERHLVITVGEHFYLALAKGPLDQTHVLLLPVTHVQCSALLSADSWRELERFKVALTTMYRTVGKVTFFFERNYRSSHLQINVVAVDQRIEWQVRHAFVDAAEKYDLQLEELPPLREPADLPAHGPYFVAELAKGEVMLTRQMKMFPLHFGREVFCAEGVLACEQKVDWKNCELGKDEEVELVARLRGQFKPFNFAETPANGE